MTTLLRAVIEASGLSRRKAFAAIREGRVTHEGVPLVDPSVEYEGGELRLDGERLQAQLAAKTYLMMNKPPNFVTTASDELGRSTVLDLVPPELRVLGLHTVGRLDRDTSGLLLLTNDGDLTFMLTHPRHEIEKEYWVRLAEPISEEQLARLSRGVELDGERRRPVRLESAPEDTAFDLTITLREGRNRQVRRMLEAVGSRVTALRRVREGDLELGSLPEGAVRRLTADELWVLGLG
ncbi:MAG TPA: pseudouridine synthase [Dehalococcoidia bacterium]|nr:pseudouridine synthase [Dehalococcoidia bacterium]